MSSKPSSSAAQQTRCPRCLEWNDYNPWYCPQCGKDTCVNPHDGGTPGDQAKWQRNLPAASAQPDGESE